jgi:hypothetical protein
MVTPRSLFLAPHPSPFIIQVLPFSGYFYHIDRGGRFFLGRPIVMYEYTEFGQKPQKERDY